MVTLSEITLGLYNTWPSKNFFLLIVFLQSQEISHLVKTEAQAYKMHMNKSWFSSILQDRYWIFKFECMNELYRGFWFWCGFDFLMLWVWELQWQSHQYFQIITSLHSITISKKQLNNHDWFVKRLLKLLCFWFSDVVCMGVAMKISSLFPNHHFCECDNSFANQFIKNVFHTKKTFFYFIVVVCGALVILAQDGASQCVYQSSFLFKLILQIPSHNLDPPLLKNSIKFLTFFLVCLCVCVLAHTYNQIVHIVDCVAPHGKSMKAMHIHIIKQALKSKSDCMTYRR